MSVNIVIVIIFLSFPFPQIIINNIETETKNTQNTQYIISHHGFGESRRQSPAGRERDGRTTDGGET